jgi:hypothetical protein
MELGGVAERQRKQLRGNQFSVHITGIYAGSTQPKFLFAGHDVGSARVALRLLCLGKNGVRLHSAIAILLILGILLALLFCGGGIYIYKNKFTFSDTMSGVGPVFLGVFFLSNQGTFRRDKFKKYFWPTKPNLYHTRKAWRATTSYLQVSWTFHLD